MNKSREFIIWYCENEECEFPSSGISDSPMDCIQCKQPMKPASYLRNDLHIAEVAAAKQRGYEQAREQAANVVKNHRDIRVSHMFVDRDTQLADMIRAMQPSDA